MPPQPVRESHAASSSSRMVQHQETHVHSSSSGGYRSVQETRSSSTMSSLMCCTSSRSAKAVNYKESQKKFLWLDPNRWTGQKKEKVDICVFVGFHSLHNMILVYSQGGITMQIMA